MKEFENSFWISGGISGAITNPDSDEALEHAELYYKEIRKMNTDVDHIAENTEYGYSQILLVKHYLFLDKHKLGDENKLFDSCFEIAESWRRLAFDQHNIQEHDLLLIKHELSEISLVAQGYSQNDAHDITNKLYNYAEASREYYRKLQGKDQSITDRNTLNSGAIRRCSGRTH